MSSHVIPSSYHPNRPNIERVNWIGQPSAQVIESVLMNWGFFITRKMILLWRVCWWLIISGFRDMVILSVGKALNSVLPHLQGSQIDDLFYLERPMIDFHWEAVRVHDHLFYDACIIFISWGVVNTRLFRSKLVALSTPNSLPIAIFWYRLMINSHNC